jgi:3-oxoisoapionate kinase
MTRLLSYYGDDFTGSTDVMEALASHGVETILFTRMPTANEFAPFQNYQAVGLAGISRSQTPEWMDEHLPEIFSWLRTLNARFCHYKVCSTFDSSPTVGSIGRALDIGLRIFEQRNAPLVVGAPQLKRYTFAGHLFAGYQGRVYRIDRHPVMSRHPVTPMTESDLLQHLAHQTTREAIELIDVYDDATQQVAGEYLLANPAPFVVGSSGVEYALVKALTKKGEISGKAQFAPLMKTSQNIVASGSVSPTTERQIRFALQHGFSAVEVSAIALAKQDHHALVMASAQAKDILNAGGSPLIHTALGKATDDSVALKAIPHAHRNIGQALGQIVKQLQSEAKLPRIIFAGGDTSSHAMSQLDIYALKTRLPLPATPGSPLCTALSSNADFDTIEIALKGGQVGGDDYFVALRG